MFDTFARFFRSLNRGSSDGRPLITHPEAHPASIGLFVTIPGRSVSIGMAMCLIFSTITSCINDAKPEGVLSKDEMAKALTEFYLKEAKINTLHVDQDSAKKLMQYYRMKYADKSGVPDSIVEVSYQYYLTRPFDMSEIYDRIIDSLTLKEQRVPVNPRLVQ